MDDEERIGLSLFTLRLGVFLVMAIWTADKFLNPGHAAAVYEHFYFFSKEFAESSMIFIAVVESLILLAFAAGFQKRITYGMVFLLHTVSTLSSWKIYLDPFAVPNILFWAAWPMLAVCFTLYLLRDMDTKFTLQSDFK